VGKAVESSPENGKISWNPEIVVLEDFYFSHSYGCPESLPGWV